MTLSDLIFSNRFTGQLSADPLNENRARPVRAAFSRVLPTPVKNPHLLAWSPETAGLLGLSEAQDPLALAAVFSGNRQLSGMDPFAACYGGHQFGHWAGQLGDGRAITLGEVKTLGGEYWEVQLKGAGPTPYSRHADGRAVLRSSVREFICSEAMHHLGIPSTRALCLVGTGESVIRDMFYDGHPEAEPGAIVTRVAPSFLRFGNFELPAARRDRDQLMQLAAFTLTHYYPELGAPGPEAYLALFQAVQARTLDLMIQWMRVGFVHGVMNTDNLSILGLTLDYGPYGWLDDFNPAFTPNTSDREGRYCYANQPHCALWNLSCLANAWVPLVGDVTLLNAELQAFQQRYEAAHQVMMAAKLGFSGSEEGLAALISEWQTCLASAGADMTLTYRALADLAFDREVAPTFGDLPPDCFYTTVSPVLQQRWTVWLQQYQDTLRHARLGDAERRAHMNAVNPSLIPRNYLVYQVIEALEAGDKQPLTRLMDALKTPYRTQAEYADLSARRPDWARQVAGCSALSCSS